MKLVVVPLEIEENVIPEYQMSKGKGWNKGRGEIRVWWGVVRVEQGWGGTSL